MMVKMHQRRGEVLLAACDSELVGRKLTQDKLSLEVRESFYAGEAADEAIFMNRLELATMANLVGERVVAIAVDCGAVDQDHVIMIDGVPHAQMVRM